MSNRTAQAAKAIRLAWASEQQLVRDGKGTRDWSPEQQKDILDRGRAYDEAGKAFEGHHMKSAERYPEHQGDPSNIQFLSRSEHLAAHGGSFQNPTNGIFDILTGETHSFGQSAHEPCQVINLSSPIISSDQTTPTPNERDMASASEEPQEAKKASPQKKRVVADANSNYKCDFAQEPSSPNAKPTPSKKPIGKLSANIKRLASGARNFIAQNSDKIAPVVTEVVIPALVSIAVDNVRRRSTSQHYDDSIRTEQGSNEVANSISTRTIAESGDIEVKTASIDRASPREHQVTGYTRQQNGKTVHVRQYTRGHNKDT